MLGGYIISENISISIVISSILYWIATYIAIELNYIPPIAIYCYSINIVISIYWIAIRIYIYIAIFKLAIAGSSSLGAQALIDALVQGLEKHQGQLRGSAVEVHGKRWEKTGKLEVEQCGTCFFLIFLGRTLGDYGKCMDAIFGFSCWVFIVVF